MEPTTELTERRPLPDIPMATKIQVGGQCTGESARCLINVPGPEVIGMEEICGKVLEIMSHLSDPTPTVILEDRNER